MVMVEKDILKWPYSWNCVPLVSQKIDIHRARIYTKYHMENGTRIFTIFKHLSTKINNKKL